jgi:hypothetical protein
MNFPELVKDQVWARAAGCCERCGLALFGGDYSFHHRRLKGMGGDKRPETQQPANCVLLCGSGTTGCHGWAHHNRVEAGDAGFIVSRWADPADVGFLSALRGWVLIDNDGGVERWRRNEELV